MPQDDPLSRVVEVFEAHRAALFSYARGLVTRLRIQGVYSADDVLGEVALIGCQKALTSSRSIPQDSRAVIAWLMRTALFVCLNRFRKSQNEKRVAEEYKAVLREQELRNVLDEDPKALWQEVERFLGSLDASERRLLELSLRDNFTSAEIGEMLNMQAATVRKQKSRLLERLYTYLMK